MRGLGGGSFVVTVTPNNITALAKDVMITVSVTDKAGNKSESTPAGVAVKLAARTFTSSVAPVVDAKYSSAAPNTGNIGRGGTITVTFDKNPGPVTSSVGAVTGTGATRTITIPTTRSAGPLSLTISWGTSGTTTLTYTITVDLEAPLADLTVSAGGYVIIVKSKAGIASIESLPASVTNAMRIEWAGMPDLEESLLRRWHTGVD